MKKVIDREMVAAAHAARELGCVSRTEGAMSMAVSDCIENEHFDTINELNRQQHEALDALLKEQETASMEYRLSEWQAAMKLTRAVLALWPDNE